MILLTQMHRLRMDLGLSEHMLAKLTGIDQRRVHQIEYVTNKVEPWIDEATRIGRVLGVSIGVLIGVSDDLTHYPTLSAHPGLPPALASDLDMLRSGVRLPLGLACRIAVTVGVPDPADLFVSPVMQEVWSIIAVGERTPTLRTCPWCNADTVGGAAHLPTCLPSLLWGERGRHLAEVTVPRLPRSGEHSGSETGRGLKTLRKGMKLTQAQFARKVGIPQNGYAILERMERPLTIAMANRIAQALNIDRAILYREPAAPPPVDESPIDLTSAPPPGAVA